MTNHSAAQLAFGKQAEIVQDGSSVSVASLHERATGLAASLQPYGRVAICTARTDSLALAMVACTIGQIELLLLRQPSMFNTSSLAVYGVDALLHDDGRIEPTQISKMRSREFMLLLATSGTTGEPKIARHRLNRLTGRIRAPSHGSDAGTWLLTYHPASFAGIQVILSTLIGGGRLLACSEPTVANLAIMAADFLPTHISATPTFWRALLMMLGDRAVDIPLRRITLGGEPVDQGILDRLGRLYPRAGITHIYASTEAGALFAVHDKRSGFPSSWLNEPVDGVRFRIRDGVLEVMSPRSSLGYQGDRVRIPYSDDGWLITNDLVEAQDDRVLFQGRVDSVINVGGAKVTPDEVERCLLSIPGVMDARAYAVPSPITGSLVGASICIAPGYLEKEMRPTINKTLRSALDPYKVPRLIEFVDAMEISETGKKSRQS